MDKLELEVEEARTKRRRIFTEAAAEIKTFRVPEIKEFVELINSEKEILQTSGVILPYLWEKHIANLTESKDKTRPGYILEISGIFANSNDYYYFSDEYVDGNIPQMRKRLLKAKIADCQKNIDIYTKCITDFNNSCNFLVEQLNSLENNNNEV